MGKQLQRKYDIESVALGDVVHLFEDHHAYKGVGKTATYVFAVIEDSHPVAAFVWLPAPPGTSKALSPDTPGCVLSLSRMVAVPRDQRRLNHISKPLRLQMRQLIDRTRWPVLVTYSDEGCGHTGHVYKCSGWRATVRNKRPIYEDQDGVRRSPYSGGLSIKADLIHVGHTWIQRWEHWACTNPAEHMRQHGWVRQPTGKLWRNGNPAHTWVRE